MSIFSSLLKKAAPKLLGFAAELIPGGTLVKTGLKLAAPALKSVFSKTGAKVVAGAAVTAAGVGVARSMMGGGGGSSGQLPALPGLQSGGGGFAPSSGGYGTMPVPQPGQANQYAPRPLVLDISFARQYYRAPKGYVILRDPNGQIYCVDKTYARKNGWWKPARKPLLSATDSYHLRRNQQLIKKARKAIGPLIKTATKGTRCAPPKKGR